MSALHSKANWVDQAETLVFLTYKSFFRLSNSSEGKIGKCSTGETSRQNVRMRSRQHIVHCKTCDMSASYLHSAMSLSLCGSVCVRYCSCIRNSASRRSTGVFHNVYSHGLHLLYIYYIYIYNIYIYVCVQVPKCRSRHFGHFVKIIVNISTTTFFRLLSVDFSHKRKPIYNVTMIINDETTRTVTAQSINLFSQLCKITN